MNRIGSAPTCTIVSSTMAVLLIAGLLSFFPDLTGRVYAQADPASGQASEEESTEKVEDGTMTDAQFDEQIEQLALFNPPPQLSGKEVGITVIPCDFGVSFDDNDVEGDSYYCGVLVLIR